MAVHVSVHMAAVLSHGIPRALPLCVPKACVENAVFSLAMFLFFFWPGCEPAADPWCRRRADALPDRDDGPLHRLGGHSYIAMALYSYIGHNYIAI